MAVEASTLVLDPDVSRPFVRDLVKSLSAADAKTPVSNISCSAPQLSLSSGCPSLTS